MKCFYGSGTVLLMLRKRMTTESDLFPRRPSVSALNSLESFPLRPPLPLPPLPEGVSRTELFDWLKSVRVANAPETISSYCVQDFERFVQTFGLVQRAVANAQGPVTGLKLGGNPYFTTMLLKTYTSADWRIGNYFGSQVRKGEAVQRVHLDEFRKPGPRHTSI
jgi:hypothetical protein